LKSNTRKHYGRVSSERKERKSGRISCGVTKVSYVFVVVGTEEGTFVAVCPTVHLLGYIICTVKELSIPPANVSASPPPLVLYTKKLNAKTGPSRKKKNGSGAGRTGRCQAICEGSSYNIV